MFHHVRKRKHATPQPVQILTEIDEERYNFYILAG